MATRLKAIAVKRPRIKRGDTADVKDAANLIAGRTSATEGGVFEALNELRYALFFFLKAGRAVNLPGLGYFSPSMSLDGTINVNLRVDPELLGDLNKKVEGFKGKVINALNIGKTSDELVALWNEEHPEDPVV